MCSYITFINLIEKSMNSSIFRWEGRPSQILNFFPFLVTFTIIGLIVYFASEIYFYMPNEIKSYVSWRNIAILCAVIFLYPISKYLSLKCHQYTITDDKIYIKSGVLSSKIESAEMFRVKDQTIVKPLFLRIFGMGNLILLTSDPTTPTIKINAIRDVELLLHNVQKCTVAARKQHGVREFD